MSEDLEMIWPVIARLFESLRDAIDFGRGAMDMDFWWHALKWPQYFCWMMFGNWFRLQWREKWWKAGLSLLIAWPVFEIGLKLFRMIDWR